MSLGKKQEEFSFMIATLILWAYNEGYKIRCGDFWAHDGHKDGSFHYKKLAADLNLFKDGVFLIETADHLPLGEEWERMGGTWGGRFNDGNHYSLGE